MHAHLVAIVRNPDESCASGRLPGIFNPLVQGSSPCRPTNLRGLEQRAASLVASVRGWRRVTLRLQGVGRGMQSSPGRKSSHFRRKIPLAGAKRVCFQAIAACAPRVAR